MLFRGLEIILKGRDPRDAPLITQRSCGVCTYVHMSASSMAVDAAMGVKVPPTAQIIRNLLMAAQFIHDHPVHFYQLHALDWVDVVSALQADPKKTADLANAAAFVADRDVEAPVDGAVGVVVPEMPLAEVPRAVAVGGEHVGHGHLAPPQEGAS